MRRSIRDRPYYVNVLISLTKEQFHCLLVRDLSKLVAGCTSHNIFTHVRLYCLYCFPSANLFEALLPECSIHPEQKVIYP